MVKFNIALCKINPDNHICKRISTKQIIVGEAQQAKASHCASQENKLRAYEEITLFYDYSIGITEK